MTQRTAFRGKTLNLFLVGIVALLIVPLIPWFDYGSGFEFLPEVSLVYLFMRGARIDLGLYLAGVDAAIISVAVTRKPLFFLGVLPASFPLFTLVAVVTISLSGYSQAYMQALTPGVLLAFLGSALLEASYFRYRKEIRTLALQK